MPSNREIADSLDLMNLLTNYYFSRSRKFSHLGGEEKDGGFSSYLIIDRKHVIEYFIATDHRNFFSCVSLGIGPRFIPMYMLVDEDSSKKFSMDNTVEALEKNLSALDDYLAGKLK